MPHGILKGKDKGFYYSYESIPYAKAPVGDLRFEAPQPYEDKWNVIFDATEAPVPCLQWHPLIPGENKLMGSEDCLFVNVYKPKTGKKMYPVVAYIHGGAFTFGAANMFGEDIFMTSSDMILVSISYRLGPLGFLSTGDEYITGNYGLKDQRMALKWIKDNIQYFNGDPDNILLMGFSAGATSTHLHMLNPFAENMVKAAYSVSGVALNHWIIINNPKERALQVSQHLQCPDLTNTNAIKQCLKQKPADDIVASITEILTWGFNPLVAFGPVVESKNAPQPFMTEHPRDIIKSGNFSHIPWLISHTKDDGGFNAAEMMQINPETGETYLNDFKDKWLELAPENLFLENIHDDPNKYAQELLDHYLGNLTFSEENYMKLQELNTDVFFINGIKETLKLHSHYSTAPIYAYVYDNPADYSLANLLANRTDIQFGKYWVRHLTFFSTSAYFVNV